MPKPKLPKLSVLAWSVCYVLRTASENPKKPISTNNKAPTVTHLNQVSAQRERAETRLVFSSRCFRLLLSNPHNTLREQIILELPSLQGFRTGEVSSFQAEYANFDLGLIGVMDSKKHRMFWNPMRKLVGKHLFQYMRETGIWKGTLIQPLPNAPHVGRKLGSKTPGLGLSTAHLKAIWQKCCLDTGIPIMTPREGRAYFAVWWVRVKHKDFYYAMVQLRHTKPEVTMRYLAHILDADDLMAEFQDADSDSDAKCGQGQLSPFSPLSLCKFSSGCPLAAPDCRCRMFQPELTVVTK